MNTPAPQTVAQTLFNEVGDLTIADYDSALQLRFRISSELKKPSANPVLRVALARVKAILGDRAAALDELQKAQGQGALAEPAARGNAAAIYTNLAEWEKSANLKSGLSPQSPNDILDLLSWALSCGNVARIEQIMADHRTKLEAFAPEATEFFAHVCTLDFKDMLGRHQEIVRGFVRDHQCDLRLGGVTADSGERLWFVNHYVNLDIRAALDASDAITQALFDFYEGQGLLPGCWVGVFQPDIIPLETLRP